VELTDVLLLADGDRVTVGSSTVPGAKVTAEVVGQGRGPKVTIFKYKSKTRQRTKTGHRQPYTRLAIQEIVTAEKPAAKRARVKAEAKPTEETAAKKPAVKEPAAEKPAAKKPAAEKPAAKKPAAKRAKVKAEAKPTEETTESKPKRAPRRKVTSHGT
jgi:large subunit ribosomal protein L21